MQGAHGRNATISPALLGKPRGDLNWSEPRDFIRLAWGDCRKSTFVPYFLENLARKEHAQGYCEGKVAACVPWPWHEGEAP